MSYRSALAVAGTAATSAAVLLAPSAQAAGVSAAPGFTSTVHQATVNYVASLTGTQHSGMIGKTAVAQPGPMSYTIDFGDGTSTAGDAGMAECSSTGVAPLKFSTPGTHTYAKPGIYTVKVSFSYCGGASNSDVARSYRVTIGAPSAAVPVTPVPVRTVIPAPAVKAPVAVPAAKASVAAPAAKTPVTSGPVTGPKVQTDVVRSTSDSTETLGAGALGLAGLALAGGLFARKSRTN